MKVDSLYGDRAVSDAVSMPKLFSFADEEIGDYQQRMKDLYHEEISFNDAKARLRQLLHLYWVLAHRPPAEGEPPYTPPPPPWIGVS